MVERTEESEPEAEKTEWASNGHSQRTELNIWNIEHTNFVFRSYKKLDRGTDVSSVYIEKIFQKTQPLEIK